MIDIGMENMITRLIRNIFSMNFKLIFSKYNFDSMYVFDATANYDFNWYLCLRACDVMD